MGNFLSRSIAAAFLCPFLPPGQRPAGENGLEVKDPSGAAMEAS